MGFETIKNKVKLSKDGHQWCALYGENLQDGVSGFGNTPEQAYNDFLTEWKKYQTWVL